MSNLNKFVMIFFAALIVLLLFVDSLIINKMTPEVFNKKPFPQFQTKSLIDQTVNNNIFNDKITIICVWATNAEICFAFLTNLSQLKIPANVQRIGLVGDVKENDNFYKLKSAQKISADCSADMIQLLVNDDFAPLLEYVRTVPFVCFVDSQGNFIGQPVTGANVQLVEHELNRLLEKDSPKRRALEDLQKAILNAH